MNVQLTDDEVKEMPKHLGASYAGTRFGWDTLTKAQIQWCERIVAARLAAAEALAVEWDTLGEQGADLGEDGRSYGGIAYDLRQAVRNWPR